MEKIKILAVLLLVGLICFSNVKLTKNAINECVKNGNDYNFCVEELR